MRNRGSLVLISFILFPFIRLSLIGVVCGGLFTQANSSKLTVVTLDRLSALSAKGSEPSRTESRLRDTTVTLKKEDWTDFDRAIRVVADQGKIAIVAEGLPVLPKFPPEDVPAETMTLGAALAEIARRFDYEALPVKANSVVFPMQKRYTQPIDIPCVTPEEWALAVKDMTDILRPFRPDPPIVSNETFVKEFARSLSAEQSEQLKSGGLPVASLSEQQKGQTLRLVLVNYGIRYNIFEGMTPFFRRMTKMDVGFGKHDGLTVLNFGVVGDSSQSLFEGGTPFKSHDDGSDIDLSGLTKGEANLTKWKADRSIQALLSRLAPRSEVPQMADAALEQKIVTVAGERNAAPPEILRAIAAIYGLRVLTETGADGKSRLRLTRPRRPQPADLSGVPKALYAALPEPYFRYLQVAITKKEERTGRGVQGYLTRRQDRTRDALRVAVVALRQSLEERAAREGLTAEVKRGAKRYPLKTLGVGEQSAFALANSGSILPEFISAFGDALPPVTAHWQEATMQGGPYKRDGRSYFGLRIYYETENPDGSKDGNGGGMGDVPFEPEPSGP